MADDDQTQNNDFSFSIIDDPTFIRCCLAVSSALGSALSNFVITQLFSFPFFRFRFCVFCVFCSATANNKLLLL